MKMLRSIGLILAVLLTVLGFTGTANSYVRDYDKNTITTVKGDNPWRISYGLWGTGKFHKVIEDAFGITDPRKLAVGKTVEVPTISPVKLSRFNVLPRRAKIGKGSDIKNDFDTTEVKKHFSPDQLELFRLMIESKNPDPVTMQIGEKFECGGDARAFRCPPKAGFEFAVPVPGFLWIAEDLDKLISCELFLAEECRNPYARCKKIVVEPTREPEKAPEAVREETKETIKEAQVEKQAPSAPPPIKENKEPIQAPAFVEVKKASEDFWELYVGGVYYQNIHNGDANGEAAWLKSRYFPWNIKDKDVKYRFGGFISGFANWGEDGDFKYRNKRFAFGPSAKAEGDTWDATLDLGFGWLWKEGHNSNGFDGDQTDSIGVVAANVKDQARRKHGEKLLPEREYNLEAIIPFSKHDTRSFRGKPLASDPWDDQRIEVSVTQYIYDFQVGENQLLTPGVTLGLGYDWGPGKSFGEIGPAVKLSSYGHNVAFLSAGYKEEFGGKGDQWKVGGWLSVNGIINAYEAAHITEASASDLVVGHVAVKSTNVSEKKQDWQPACSPK